MFPLLNGRQTAMDISGQTQRLIEARFEVLGLIVPQQRFFGKKLKLTFLEE